MNEKIVLDDIKIGIDLSTRKTGISLSAMNFKMNYLFTIENLGWGSEAWKDSLKNFKTKLMSFVFDFIRSHQFIEERKKINVAIELIRSSDENSQRFHFYAGMIYTLFKLAAMFEVNEFDVEIKFVSPNEWFQYLLEELGFNPQSVLEYSREKRKSLSLEFAKKITKKENITEDEADAFCINYLQNKCRCNSEVALEVRERKHFKNTQAKEKRHRIYTIQRRVETLNKWIAKCNLKYSCKEKPKKTAIHFQNWLNELKDLEVELNELTKRKKQNS